MTLESEPTRQNNKAPNASGKTDAQTPQGNPDIPRASGIPSSPPPKAHCEITCKTEKNFWDHVKTGAEIIGIILLGVYTAYTIKMYCTNKQAADAATSAAKTARESLDSTQRAFVIFKQLHAVKIVLRLPSKEINQIDFFGTWENAGTTPAPRTLRHFGHGILPDEPNEKQFIGKGLNDSYVVGFVGPKDVEESGPIAKDWSLFVKDPHHTTISVDRHFFWGWNAYKDIFSGSKPHLTEFCQELYGTGIVANSDGSVVLQTGDCTRHNCTDEYCEDYPAIVKMVAERLEKAN